MKQNKKVNNNFFYRDKEFFFWTVELQTLHTFIDEKKFVYLILLESLNYFSSSTWSTNLFCIIGKGKCQTVNLGKGKCQINYQIQDLI